MYKDRIKKWRLDKNKKEYEMAAILRKKRQRDTIGKQSVFEVRGRRIGFEEVQHYFRRKRVASDIVSARHAGASTPPGISCATPPLSPRFEIGVPRSPSTPQSLAVPEQLFFKIDRYMSISFGNKTWIALQDGTCINTISGGHPEDLRYFHNYCSTSLELFRKKSFVKGRRALSKAFGLVQKIMKTEDPHTMECLLDISLHLMRENLPEIVAHLRRYISHMAKVLLETENPWGQILRLIGSSEPSFEPDQVDDTMIQCWKCMHKVYVQCLGQFHPTSLTSEMKLIMHLFGAENFALAEERLREVQLQCREVTGAFSQSSLEVIVNLGSNLYDQEKYAEAEFVARELLNNARKVANYKYEALGLEHVARAQYKQGRLDLAERSIREAVILIGMQWEGADPWALRTMVRLQSWSQDWGLGQTAEELGAEIEQRILLAKIHDDE